MGDEIKRWRPETAAFLYRETIDGYIPTQQIRMVEAYNGQGDYVLHSDHVAAVKEVWEAALDYAELHDRGECVEFFRAKAERGK